MLDVLKKSIDRAQWYCQTFKQPSRLRLVLCFPANVLRSPNFNKVFSQAKWVFFLAHLLLPFADCHLGMTIVVKSNIGGEPCKACYDYRNDSIGSLEERPGHVTSELYVR